MRIKQKLIAADVLAIRASEKSSAELAEEYGMTLWGIQQVRSGYTWTNLAPAPDLEWRAIPGWEGLYDVSRCGQIRNVQTGVLRRLGTHEQGYRQIGLTRGDGSNPKIMKVHRLVALAFIPNPEGKREVNHIDHNKANNHASNLEWVTPKENAERAVAAGAYKNRKLRAYTLKEPTPDQKPCAFCGAIMLRPRKRGIEFNKTRFCSKSCGSRARHSPPLSPPQSREDDIRC